MYVVDIVLKHVILFRCMYEYEYIFDVINDCVFIFIVMLYLKKANTKIINIDKTSFNCK